MQDKKDLKDQHPAAGPGLEGALGPCVKVGKEDKGRQWLVRSSVRVRTKEKIENRVREKLREREGRWAPVVSCLPTTGSGVKLVGCGGVGVGVGVWGLRMIGGAVKEG